MGNCIWYQLLLLHDPGTPINRWEARWGCCEHPERVTDPALGTGLAGMWRLFQSSGQVFAAHLLCVRHCTKQHRTGRGSPELNRGSPTSCNNQHTDLSKPPFFICEDEPCFTKLFRLWSRMTHAPGTQRWRRKHQMVGGLFIAEKAKELILERKGVGKKVASP